MLSNKKLLIYNKKINKKIKILHFNKNMKILISKFKKWKLNYFKK